MDMLVQIILMLLCALGVGALVGARLNKRFSPPSDDAIRDMMQGKYEEKMQESQEKYDKDFSDPDTADERALDLLERLRARDQKDK